MNNLIVILGAGFSKPAGLPLASEINARFDRNQVGKLLRISSGEWFWIDGKDSNFQYSTSLGGVPLSYSYILNEIIFNYKERFGSFIDYEHFYNWFLEIIKQGDWQKSIRKKAKETHFASNESLFNTEEAKESFSFIYDEQSSRKIQEILNYLIADLLSVNNSMIENSIHEYESFLNTIFKYDEVKIFTLNHDVLLERLISNSRRSFSRGFSYDNSDVFYEENPLPVFTNNFNDKIKIYKLHGSVDFFRFQHFEHGGGVFWQPTSNYNYFTTRGYRSKHYAIRVNPMTKEVIQDMNFDVSPKFITGTNKEEIIKNDLMFDQLYIEYENCIASAKKVLISGYSFSDIHVNSELEKNNSLEIVNQNPRNNYPFAASNIVEIEHLSDYVN